MQILRKQIEYAIGQTPTDIAGNGLCAIILYIVFIPFVNKLYLSLWLAVILLLTISRTVIGFQSLREKLGIESLNLVYRLYVPHIVLLGAAWGSAMFICFDVSPNQGYQFFLVVELAGVAAGAASSLTVFWRVYLAFLLEVIIPVAIMLFSNNDRISFWLGLLTLLFMGYLTISSKRTNSIIIEALKSRFQIEEMAKMDSLTGIYNRRCFDETIKNEFKRATRNGTSLSLILIDVDFFKRINDTQGHIIGDQILQKVAAITNQSVYRAADMVARYGGEEFVVLLPNTCENDAKRVAERIRRAIEAQHIPHPDSSCGNYLTVSAGTASTSPEHNSPPSVTDFITQADQALYKAKNSGRNQVCQQSFELNPDISYNSEPA